MKKALLSLTALAFLISCEKKTDEPEKTKVVLNTHNITMHYDEIDTLNATITPKPLDILWLTSNEKVAKVSQDGIVEGIKVGETYIKAKTLEGSDSCKVTIEPYLNLYTEPVLAWGKNTAYIKSMEKRTLVDEVANESLEYSDANTLVDYVLYTFEYGKMDGAAIVFDYSITEVEAEDFSTYYNERYDYLGSSSDLIYYGNDDILLGIGVIGNNIVTLYAERTTAKSTPDFTRILNALKTDKKVDNSRPQVWFETVKQTK